MYNRAQHSALALRWSARWDSIRVAAERRLPHPGTVAGCARGRAVRRRARMPDVARIRDVFPSFYEAAIEATRLA
jgi:hypothetical protein